MSGGPPEIPDKALTTGQWAKHWKVTRKTARAWLADLHAKYGDRVVQRYGRQGAYRASHESLRRAATGPEDGVVTHAQLMRALGEVWTVIDLMGGKKAWIRSDRSATG